MANNDRNQNQSRGRSTGAARPWTVTRMVEKADRDGNKRTEWLRCGVAWPMKEKQGYTLDIDWTIPEGSRLAIMPPKERDGDR